MNGFLLLIPFLLIRFVLLALVNRGAVRRAAHFAPMVGNEVWAYWVYQLSNAGIFVYLFFLTVSTDQSWLFYLGLTVYLLGLLLCAASILCFAHPGQNGFHDNGVYRFSRNPMYVSYFLCFAGCALLTLSPVLCGMVLLFQFSSHWIILAEERWCVEKFEDRYRQYMKGVRRYL